LDLRAIAGLVTTVLWASLVYSILRRRTLPSGEPRWSVVTALVAVFLSVAIFPAKVGHSVGPEFVLALFGAFFLAATAAISHAPALVTRIPHVGCKLRPVSRYASLIAFAWFLVGLGSNTHIVRVLPHNRATITDYSNWRVPLRSSVERWYEQKRQADGTALMILAGAAGGGLRASYWTAETLAQLDRIEGFRDHLFAISSVSGGSLGATLYRLAIVSERYRDSRSAGKGALMRSVLTSDFVGPVTAGWLFSDVASTFFPFVGFPDRSAAIEESWERAWRSSASNDLMAEDFRYLWPATDTKDRRIGSFPEDRWPHLILNGASITKGVVTVTSDLSGIAPGGEAFPKVTEVAPLRFRTSTAVNNSARFPVIEPPGMILIDPEVLRSFGLPPPREKVFSDYVVDGGYVDNFGSYALLEILDQVREFNCGIVRRQTRTSEPIDLTGCNQYRREPSAPGIVPVVIQITSDPDLVRTSMDSCGCLDAPTAWKLAPIGFRTAKDLDNFTEVAAPINMMDQMRQMNGIFSAITLAQRNDVEAYFHFGIGPPYRADGTLRRQEPPPSLNWVLSRHSIRQIDEQLQQCEGLQAHVLAEMISRPSDIRNLNESRRRNTLSRAASMPPAANRLFCR